jgi:hypothetical protein
MKKQTLKLALILFAVGGFSSLKAQQAVPATGGDAIGAGGSASYTVGQVTYKTQSSASGTETMGVQQPYEIIIVGKKEMAGIRLSCTAFPNPVVNTLNLQIDNLSNEVITYSLFDAASKLIASNKITASQTAINVESLASATYFLKVTSGKNELQTFKIIKN